MSDINIFDDPNKVPQPKENILIEHLAAEPYPDGTRVKLTIHVTPFLERPNLLLVVRRADGQIVDEMSIIATMHAEMDFTFHMRGMDDTSGDYRLEAELYYETRNPSQDMAWLDFSIPATS